MAEAACTLPIGGTVRIEGLQVMPTMNGQIGHIEEYRADVDRYTILLPNGGTVRARPKNLVLLDRVGRVGRAGSRLGDVAISRIRPRLEILSPASLVYIAERVNRVARVFDPTVIGLLDAACGSDAALLLLSSNLPDL